MLKQSLLKAVAHPSVIFCAVGRFCPDAFVQNFAFSSDFAKYRNSKPINAAIPNAMGTRMGFNFAFNTGELRSVVAC